MGTNSIQACETRVSPVAENLDLHLGKGGWGVVLGRKRGKSCSSPGLPSSPAIPLPYTCHPQTQTHLQVERLNLRFLHIKSEFPQENFSLIINLKALMGVE